MNLSDREVELIQELLDDYLQHKYFVLNEHEEGRPHFSDVQNIKADIKEATLLKEKLK